MPLLDEVIIYNEKLEVLDLSYNKLEGFTNFFRNLNRNWLSKLSQLNLKSNQLKYQDLKDFCDIFERESRPFDRLLFVLRLLNMLDNPFTKTNPFVQKGNPEDILREFYMRERKTMILI